MQVRRQQRGCSVATKRSGWDVPSALAATAGLHTPPCTFTGTPRTVTVISLLPVAGLRDRAATAHMSNCAAMAALGGDGDAGPVAVVEVQRRC